MFAQKSSVSDIRRMLSRDSQSAQTQANRQEQNSIVTSTLSYSESVRTQRQQSKNTSLALKKLKYQFKNLSSKILRSKTSQAAKQAAGQARREILRLKRQKQSGDYDSDEIEAAINHAKAMERVAKKKARHLEEEELVKIAGGICQGDRIEEEENRKADVSEAMSEAERKAREEAAAKGYDSVADDYDAYDSQDYGFTAYSFADYSYPELDLLAGSAGDLAGAMSDFTDEMMQKMSESMRDLMSDLGMDDLGDTTVAVRREMDPADFKMMKIKHRNREMKDIVRADAEYLKAVFHQLEKMKESGVVPLGNNASPIPGRSGGFSADAAGIGVPAAPAPVINITL